MVVLVRWWRGGAVGADAATGGASRAATLDDRRDADPVRADNRLVQAAAQLDSGQVASLPVHRVVVPGRQQQRASVVVRRTAPACVDSQISGQRLYI